MAFDASKKINYVVAALAVLPTMAHADPVSLLSLASAAAASAGYAALATALQWITIAAPVFGRVYIGARKAPGPSL